MTSFTDNDEYTLASKGLIKSDKLILINNTCHISGSPCLLELQDENITDVFMDKLEDIGYTNNIYQISDVMDKVFHIRSQSFTVDVLHDIIMNILTNHYANGGYQKISITEEEHDDITYKVLHTITLSI